MLLPDVSRRTVVPLILLVFSAFLPLRLRAQSAASVSGVVSDSSGAVVSGARVAIRNADTNVEQATVTGSSGDYAVVNVEPGKYSIEVTKTGFNAARETNVVLTVNQAAALNFVLQPGSVRQSVTVTAEASEIQSSTAALGAVIGTQSVNNLPLNGRNFTQLLELTPGVSRISVGQNSTGSVTGNPIGQFTFPAVNGQRNRSNMFYLDGANDTGSYDGTYNYQPIVDDIQEFKVLTHSDLAEFGQVTGGIVNVVTKSGANALHGSAWEFLRNASLFDARNYFIPKVNPLHQNQYGVTLGGPVIVPRLYHGRNKTFFFFAYEGFRQSQASQSVATTPTSAQLNGDFNNLLTNGVIIYNPFSTRPDPAHPGEYLRDAFAGNQIPTSLLSPAALLYAKTIFPAPNASGLPSGENLIDTSPSLLTSNSFSGRIDQSFGDHDFLYGRISTYTEPYAHSSGNPNAIQTSLLTGYSITVHEVHTFGPTSVLEAYFGRNIGKNTLQLTFPNAPANFATSLTGNGFSNAYLGGFSGVPQPAVVPTIGVTGYISSSGNNYQDPNNSNIYEYGGSFSKVWNRHTMKVGGIVATNNFQQAIAEANETTTTFQTSNLENPTSPSGATTGDALASFLLGVPATGIRRGAFEREHGGWVDGAYAQDQIQVNPRLTLNLGVRWDVTIWPVYGYLSDGQGYVGDMNLRNGTYILTAQPPACSSTVGAPCIPGGTLPADVTVTANSDRKIHNTDYSNWQGRVGLAYHPLAKTSVLAGYGRFYDNWSIATQISQNLGGTWPSVGLLNANTLNQTTPTSTIGDPLSLGTTLVQPAATPFNNATFYFNPNMKTPYSDQWNLSVQQGFGANTVFTLAYVGSHSSRLDLGGLFNTAQYPAPGTAAQVAARREYPYIIPTNFDDSTGNSNYNALQSTVNKVTSDGLTYLLSYTWSKSIDLACSGSFGSEGCLLQNPYDPQADRSVSGFDLTNQFSGSVVYEIPFGAGRTYRLGNGLLNNAFGGWNINAIASLTSGTPYSVTVNGDIANVGNTFVQADLIGSPNPQRRTPAEWINPAAFQSPPRYSFGTFGRNALRSDWDRDLDLSVFKTFSLVRGANLEFRAEAFNLTNTTVFAAPNSVVGTPTFGVVSATANTPREFQLALKIQF